MDTKNNALSTPGSAWRQAGEPDPHAGYYDCERAKLAMGHLTDDELANGAFMNYDQPLNVEGILAGTHSSPIAWMTAVKDRIRWLSRALAAAEAERDALFSQLSRTTFASRDVLAERRRQVEVECWMPAGDDEYTRCQLARAAATYAAHAAFGSSESKQFYGCLWPFPGTPKTSTPRRDLVKAGALILAEIERLDRAEAAKINDRPAGEDK